MMRRMKPIVWVLAIMLSVSAWLPVIAQDNATLEDVAQKLQSLNISNVERAQVAAALAEALGEGQLTAAQALSILNNLEEQLNQGLDASQANDFVGTELASLGISADPDTPDDEESDSEKDEADEEPEDEEDTEEDEDEDEEFEDDEESEIEEDPDDDCEFDLESGQYDEDCDDFDEDDQCEFNLETGRFDEDCFDFGEDESEDDEENEEDEENPDSDEDEGDEDDD